MVLWSNRQFKRMLEKLRSGLREPWEVAKDASDDYKVSMFSEMERDKLNKKTGRVERLFMKIGNRPNHKWDCENMILVQMVRRNLLHVAVEQADAPTPVN